MSKWSPGESIVSGKSLSPATEPRSAKHESAAEEPKSLGAQQAAGSSAGGSEETATEGEDASPETPQSAQQEGGPSSRSDEPSKIIRATSIPTPGVYSHRGSVSHQSVVRQPSWSNHVSVRGEPRKNVVLPIATSESPTFELLETPSEPKIRMTVGVWQDIGLIIESVPGNNEVGWLGTVLEEDGVYTIDELFLFEQRVHSATCEITGEALSKVIEPIMDKDPRRGSDVIKRLRFWGHLHPHNSPSPSGQDEDQMNAFKDAPFFIRGIFCPNGKCEFTFYDFESGVRWLKCPWSLDTASNSARRDFIRKEIQEKVEVGYGGGYNYGTGGRVSPGSPFAAASQFFSSFFGNSDKVSPEKRRDQRKRRGHK